MATEDRYGQQLQTWFETNASEDGKSMHDAVKAVGCSRQRAYQWLATGAVDVIETGEMSARGAKLYRYVPGTKDRPTAGRGRRAVVSAGVGAGDTGSNVLRVRATDDLTPTIFAAGLIGHTLRVLGIRLEGDGLVIDCRDDTDGAEMHFELV